MLNRWVAGEQANSSRVDRAAASSMECGIESAADERLWKAGVGWVDMAVCDQDLLGKPFADTRRSKRARYCEATSSKLGPIGT